MLLGGLAPSPALAQSANGMIVYETDFGLRDGAVASMKGVALQVDPALRLFDLTHDVPPFDVWVGAYQLETTLPFWPAGTVFVVVVDPGVGTKRDPVVAVTDSGHYVVAPDNGLLTLVADNQGIGEVRRIDESRHRLPGSEGSHTFHGRDLFSITGAKLASGAITFADVGPILGSDIVRMPYQRPEVRDGVVRGMIPILDVNFGNVWTNVDRTTFAKLGIEKGQRALVRILDAGTLVYEEHLPYVDTFGDVPEGEPLLYFNSQDKVAFALNLGDFANTHGIGYGAAWEVEISRR
jgi:S-adenosylmethionine hydrolase